MLQSLTIAVVFRNEESKILNCLSSLKNIRDYVPTLKIILVDNASTDRSSEVATTYLASQGYKFELIQRNKNHMGQARNEALLRTQTEYLYFTDADCELNAQTWSELMKEFKPFEGYAAWGGAQTFPAKNDFQISMEKMRSFYLGNFGSAQMIKGEVPMDIDHLSTSHVLYHVGKVRSVSGFNSKLYQAAEDLDLSLRLTKAGYKLRFVPKSTVNHNQFESIFEWFPKAFRNGQWQTRLMAYNLQILRTPRPWPGLLILFLFPILVPLLLFYFCCIGLIVGLEHDLNFKEKVGLAQAFLVTHLAYGLGEVFGVFRAVVDKIRQ